MITYNKPSVWKMQIEIRTKDRILSRADSIICHNKPEREGERFRHEDDVLRRGEANSASHARPGRNLQDGLNRIYPNILLKKVDFYLVSKYYNVKQKNCHFVKMKEHQTSGKRASFIRQD